MNRTDITVKGWGEYELLDCGSGRKLERFAGVVLNRPDPQALWDKSDAKKWNSSQAQFMWATSGEKWKIEKDLPDTWEIKWGDLTFQLSFKGFKHIGIFPEHSEQWSEIMKFGKINPGLRMLNLFGYTGAASLAGAVSEMLVTHVDASKATNLVFKENMKNSGLNGDEIRILTEDALQYAKRLVTRGEMFEVIVMDPPAFGRGAKGEVWKVVERLAELVALVPKLLSPKAKLVILNGYAAGYSARTFGELLKQNLPKGEIVYGDIGIQQKNSERVLSTGIYAKWSN